MLKTGGMRMIGIFVLLIIIGGVLVWPMIARLIEQLINKESIVIPVVYLSIYTELILIYFVWYVN